MALLPGWDRQRLEAADPADVEAARWLVFAQGVKPIVDDDIDGQLEQLAQADMEPKARERRGKHLRAKAREALHKRRTQQDAIRKILELDAEADD